MWTLSNWVPMMFVTVPVSVTAYSEVGDDAGFAHENNPANTSVMRYVRYCRCFINFLADNRFSLFFSISRVGSYDSLYDDYACIMKTNLQRIILCVCNVRVVVDEKIDRNHNASSLIFVLRHPFGIIFLHLFLRPFDKVLVVLQLIGKAFFNCRNNLRLQEHNKFRFFIRFNVGAKNIP